MKLEELTQKNLDYLLACGTQRAILAAAIEKAMTAEAVSEDALKIKRRIMSVFAVGIALHEPVRDDIEKDLLESMKAHCEEQIEINDILNNKGDE